MVRRPAPPPKPKSPILTVGQKRRRIERLQKCVTSLEAFDPQKVRKRFGNPEALALDGTVPRPVRGPRRHEAQAQEARHYFSEGKGRSIALLREAISTLEGEIAATKPGAEAPKESKAAAKAGEAAQPGVPKESTAPEKAGEVLQLQPKRSGGIDLEAAWRRVRRWWGGRN